MHNRILFAVLLACAIVAVKALVDFVTQPGWLSAVVFWIAIGPCVAFLITGLFPKEEVE